jgi:hypothetical protein
VPQGCKQDCSPEFGCGVCNRAQCQADLSWAVDAAVSKKRRLPSGRERATKVKRMPAQCPSCEARTCEFSAGGKRPERLPPEGRSGSQEDTIPTSAEKVRMKPRDMRAIPGQRIATEQGSQVLLTGGATGPKDGIQVDCSWEQGGRRDTGNRNSEGGQPLRH